MSTPKPLRQRLMLAELVECVSTEQGSSNWPRGGHKANACSRSFQWPGRTIGARCVLMTNLISGPAGALCALRLLATADSNGSSSTVASVELSVSSTRNRRQSPRPSASTWARRVSALVDVTRSRVFPPDWRAALWGTKKRGVRAPPRCAGSWTRPRTQNVWSAKVNANGGANSLSGVNGPFKAVNQPFLPPLVLKVRLETHPDCASRRVSSMMEAA